MIIIIIILIIPVVKPTKVQFNIKICIQYSYFLKKKKKTNVITRSLFLWIKFFIKFYYLIQARSV